MPRQTKRGEILRITNKKLKVLLELCKQHECLWNSNLEGYPNKHARTLAAKDIAEQLQIEGFTHEHVMIKFSNIRRSYCLELKKIALSEEKVARGEAEHVRQPPAVWFPIMNSFIKPFVQLKTTGLETIPNIKRKKKSQTETMQNKQMECPAETCVDLAIQKVKKDPVQVERSDQELEQFVVQHDFNIKKEPVEQDDHVQSTSTDYLLENEGDFHQCFGKYVASLLNKMPPEKALELQPKILRLIFSNFEES